MRDLSNGFEAQAVFFQKNSRYLRKLLWHTMDRSEKLGFIGEFENAKCKMQNAKLMKPFAVAKAYLVVKVHE